MHLKLDLEHKPTTLQRNKCWSKHPLLQTVSHQEASFLCCYCSTWTQNARRVFESEYGSRNIGNPWSISELRRFRFRWVGEVRVWFEGNVAQNSWISINSSGSAQIHTPFCSPIPKTLSSPTQFRYTTPFSIF